LNVLFKELVSGAKVIYFIYKNQSASWDFSPPQFLLKPRHLTQTHGAAGRALRLGFE
jgi:hypothetical protein